MSIEDLKGLKYYILYGAVVIGFFTYSSAIGWNWFNSTSTEQTRTGTTRVGSGYIFRSHK